MMIIIPAMINKYRKVEVESIPYEAQRMRCPLEKEITEWIFHSQAITIRTKSKDLQTPNEWIMNFEDEEEGEEKLYTSFDI